MAGFPSSSPLSNPGQYFKDISRLFLSGGQASGFAAVMEMRLDLSRIAECPFLSDEIYIDPAVRSVASRSFEESILPIEIFYQHIFPVCDAATRFSLVWTCRFLSMTCKTTLTLSDVFLDFLEFDRDPLFRFWLPNPSNGKSLFIHRGNFDKLAQLGHTDTLLALVKEFKHEMTTSLLAQYFSLSLSADGTLFNCLNSAIFAKQFQTVYRLRDIGAPFDYECYYIAETLKISEVISLCTLSDVPAVVFFPITQESITIKAEIIDGKYYIHPPFSSSSTLSIFNSSTPPYSFERVVAEKGWYPILSWLISCRNYDDPLQKPTSFLATNLRLLFNAKADLRVLKQLIRQIPQGSSRPTLCSLDISSILISKSIKEASMADFVKFLFREEFLDLDWRATSTSELFANGHLEVVKHIIEDSIRKGKKSHQLLSRFSLLTLYDNAVTYCRFDFLVWLYQNKIVAPKDLIKSYSRAKWSPFNHPRPFEDLLKEVPFLLPSLISSFSPFSGEEFDFRAALGDEILSKALLSVPVSSLVRFRRWTLIGFLMEKEVPFELSEVEQREIGFSGEITPSTIIKVFPSEAVILNLLVRAKLQPGFVDVSRMVSRGYWKLFDYLLRNHSNLVTPSQVSQLLRLIVKCRLPSIFESLLDKNSMAWNVTLVRDLISNSNEPCLVWAVRKGLSVPKSELDLAEEAHQSRLFEVLAVLHEKGQHEWSIEANDSVFFDFGSSLESSFEKMVTLGIPFSPLKAIESLLQLPSLTKWKPFAWTSGFMTPQLLVSAGTEALRQLFWFASDTQRAEIVKLAAQSSPLVFLETLRLLVGKHAPSASPLIQRDFLPTVLILDSTYPGFKEGVNEISRFSGITSDDGFLLSPVPENLVGLYRKLFALVGFLRLGDQIAALSDEAIRGALGKVTSSSLRSFHHFGTYTGEYSNPSEFDDPFGFTGPSVPANPVLVRGPSNDPLPPSSSSAPEESSFSIDSFSSFSF